MRPVRKGDLPIPGNFKDYKNAKPYLISRMGSYCSYCERRIDTLLAVEHIQPKNLPAYAHLILRWDNFLLGCVNCNSAKSDKDVPLDAILLPDRDNTIAAFVYTPDGEVKPAPELSGPLRKMAEDTLSLTGLDKKISQVLDENEKMVAIDRVSQRAQTWAIAEIARDEIVANPGNESVRRLTLELAIAKGYFSIWMTIFKADMDMRNRLIDSFKGTRDSGCFDPETSAPVLPAPNPDGLPFGSKL